MNNLIALSFSRNLQNTLRPATKTLITPRHGCRRTCPSLLLTIPRPLITFLQFYQTQYVKVLITAVFRTGKIEMFGVLADSTTKLCHICYRKCTSFGTTTDANVMCRLRFQTPSVRAIITIKLALIECRYLTSKRNPANCIIKSERARILNRFTSSCNIRNRNQHQHRPQSWSWN